MMAVYDLRIDVRYSSTYDASMQVAQCVDEVMVLVAPTIDTLSIDWTSVPRDRVLQLLGRHTPRKLRRLELKVESYAMYSQLQSMQCILDALPDLRVLRIYKCDVGGLLAGLKDRPRLKIETFR